MTFHDLPCRVWRLPQNFLSGIGLGYLKLDIVLVYLVSTFAVTGTGAVILAATEELSERRAALGLPEPTSLLEVWRYIRWGRLDLPPSSGPGTPGSAEPAG